MIPGHVVDSIFLNGTVGSGKSTLAEAISASEHVPHALIDLDGIRRLMPAPVNDPFNHGLELQNLRSLAANYRAAGARRFILAGVIEDAHDVDNYKTALASSRMLVVRLISDPATLNARLRERHKANATELEWHLGRVGELASILERANLDDLVMDTGASSPEQLATTVRQTAGWDHRDET